MTPPNAQGKTAPPSNSTKLAWAFVFTTDGKVLLTQRKGGLIAAPVELANDVEPALAAYKQAIQMAGHNVEPLGILPVEQTGNVFNHGFVFMLSGATTTPAENARWVPLLQLDELKTVLPSKQNFARAAELLEHPTVDFVKARDRAETLTPEEVEQCDLWLHVLGMKETNIHSIVSQRMTELNLPHNESVHDPKAKLPDLTGEIGDSSPLFKDEIENDFLLVPQWASLAKTDLEMSQPPSENLKADGTQFVLGQPFRHWKASKLYESGTSEQLWSEWAAPLLENQAIVMQERFAGNRMQLHYMGEGKGHLFTETGEDRWSLFPKLGELCARLGAQNFAMDCQFVQWTGASKPTPIPHWEMTWMLVGNQQQTAPVVLNVFDLMWMNGSTLTNLPYSERLGQLKTILPERITLLEKVLPRPYTEAQLTFSPVKVWEVKDQPSYAENLTRALREPGSSGAILMGASFQFDGNSHTDIVEYESTTKLIVQVIGWHSNAASADTEETPEHFAEAAKAERTYVFRAALGHNGKLIPLETDSAKEVSDVWNMCSDFDKDAYQYAETLALALGEEPTCGMVLEVMPSQFRPFQMQDKDGLETWRYGWQEPRVKRALPEGTPLSELTETLKAFGYQPSEVLDRPEDLIKSFLRKTDNLDGSIRVQCPYCSATLADSESGWSTCGYCKNVFWSDIEEQVTYRQDEADMDPPPNCPILQVVTDGNAALQKGLTFFEMSALANTHQGIMIALPIPEEIGKKLAALVGKIPNAEFVPVDQMHLTLAYLGKIGKVNFEQEAFENVVKNFAEMHAPLVGKIGGLGRFHGDGKEGALYATFDSFDLIPMQQMLMHELEMAGIEVEAAHGFTPHITLAYVKTAETVLVKTVEIPVRFNKLTAAWGSEDWKHFRFNRSAIQKKADPYNDPPVEQGRYRFVYQHHYRGKSAHGDLRLEARGNLIGWTVLEQVAGMVTEPVTSLDEAKRLDAMPEAWKMDWQKGVPYEADKGFVSLQVEQKEETQGTDWLTKEGIIKSPEQGEEAAAGATKNFPGVLTIMDKGEVEFGAQTPEFHEYFFYGSKLKGRWLVRKLPSGNWILVKPQEETPYVMSQHAASKKWLPPFGFSALPAIVRAKVLPAQQFWKLKPENAFPARLNLAQHFPELSSPSMRTNEEGGIEKSEISRTVQIFKSDNMQQIVWGIVLEPLEEDSQGHFITEEEIFAAEIYFMLNWQLMDEEHARVVPRTEAAPVESMQLPADMEWPVNGTTVHLKKGTWIMGTKIFSPRMWKDYLNGKLNAYSIRGWGRIRNVKKSVLTKATLA